GHTVIGFEHGFHGLLASNWRKLDTKKVHNIIQRGGTILRSARCEEFKQDAAAKNAASQLKDLAIDAILILGGDGSFRGAKHLSRFWDGQVIGLPATIDNDIFGTDTTIGYYTAIQTAMDSIDKVRDTADAFERIFLVEVMGRHAGYLGAKAAISGAANYAILPELFSDPAETLDEIHQQLSIHRKRYGHESFIIVLTENLWPEGINVLAEKLENLTGGEVRPVILGHVQRGGAPVSQDRILATTLGVEAVRCVGQNKHGIMIGQQNLQPVEVPLEQTWENKKVFSDSLTRTMKTMLNERHNWDLTR
ncbi:MAG: ATP-dependent 6-phosphofructokinase, partial [Alteromonadaceae bacterium]|nr:ATP-dependent 6-phosphofructokinase [Alteromonadaceae bacterium]